LDKQEKLRLKKLTAAAAGYHGANSANIIPPDTAEPPSTALAAASYINGDHNCEGEPVFYCWSHGLGKNPAHTSKTCSNKKDKHVTEATLMDRRGGSDRINCGKSGKARRSPPT
jgi:hypothetical protein